jgi:nitrogen fixation protein FixH
MEFKSEEITGTHIVTGVFSFFTIALGRTPFKKQTF